jgi:hypothetical protein
MTEAERFQRAWHLYEEAHGHMPASGRQACQWAYRQGLLAMPKVDPMTVMARAMCRAMRSEYETATDGRRYRVNHSFKVEVDGVQLQFWNDIDHIAHEHMEMSLQKRRQQNQADNYQIKTDRDIYRCKFPDRAYIQISFDYTEDMTEEDAKHGIYGEPDDIREEDDDDDF